MTHANQWLHNFKQDGGYLLQASMCEHEHESSLEVEGNEAY